MRKIFSIIAAAAIVGVSMSACSSTTQENTAEQAPTAIEQKAPPATTSAQPDTIKKSIPSQAEGTIGQAAITINYHAPGVRGRVIWGGLVPYDQVWVTGAHKATSVTFTKGVTIDGKEVAAGTYALFTIPGREEWTIILNKDFEQHLADDYDQKEDVLRVKVKPQALTQNQERLKYGIEGGTGTTGAITIRWEKLKVSLPVSTQR
ncbi:DUF2911 domain-containing protein [Nibribacter koreensis]|uniref:DUF2911 domain-containing protein n=1 Tax=Nibribacter koreensis TaxID=1084519 RepID=A0ABP8F658_9BACT